MDKLQMRLYDLYSYIVDGDKHSIKDIHDCALFRQLTHCMSYTATTRNVKHITLKHLPTRDLPLRM